jgi:hypothetical protein
MEQVVNLKNKTGRMIVVELEHPQAPRRRHVHHQRSRSKKGKIGIKTQRLGIHDSIILLAGEERYCLPVYVADIPAVVRLQEKGLEVVKMDRAEAEKLKAKIEKEAAAVVDAKKAAAAKKAAKRKAMAERHAAKWEPKAPAKAAAPAPKPVKKNGKGKE